MSIKRIIKSAIPQSLKDLRQARRIERMAAAAGLKLESHDLFYDLVQSKVVLRIRRAHGIYLQHMIENFHYYVDSVLPIRDDGRLLVDMSGPRYHRLRGFGDIPFLFPSHTEPYGTTTEYLDFAELSEGKVVLDIGAYSGVTSIIFAQLVGVTGHVYAFEADETNYECAKLNLEMAAKVMGLRNITLLHKAIWSHSNGVLFSNEGAMGSSAVAITGGGRGLEKIVPSTSLEDFFKEQNLEKVDFIKIDIEGGEVEMLAQAQDFLKKTKAKLIVEPHFVDGSISTARCIASLEAAGFRVKIREKVGESEPLIEASPQ